MYIYILAAMIYMYIYILAGDGGDTSSLHRAVFVF